MKKEKAKSIDNVVSTPLKKSKRSFNTLKPIPIKHSGYGITYRVRNGPSGVEYRISPDGKRVITKYIF